ncbi:MAG TPA: sucrase ferredoxin [Anaerolineales bacterium]|nr:sucrase ferredoxin [Anaerolineales bacterium]
MSRASNPTKDDSLLCSRRSKALGEQLFGSVKKTTIWLLLEYPYLWGRKAFEESDLPAQLKSHLSSFLDHVPYSKLLLIKSQSAMFNEKINCFMVISSENRPRIYRFQIDAYLDLLDLDLSSLLSEESVFSSHLSARPIFLVCTNGKRDPCCAKYGLSVYDQISAIKREQVWQTTHLGGHRFASNILCFPHGIVYGRVDLESATQLVDAYARGSILLDKYRGRACFDPQVQAADYFLRKQTHVTQIDAYRLAGVDVLKADKWRVRFHSASDGKAHQITLFTQLSEFQTYTSCDDDQLTTVLQYNMEGIETMA